MGSTCLFSLKRPCGSLKMRVQQICLGDVRSGTPGTSETGTTGGLLHRSPELSQLSPLESDYTSVCLVCDYPILRVLVARIRSDDDEFGLDSEAEEEGAEEDNDYDGLWVFKCQRRFWEIKSSTGPGRPHGEVTIIFTPPCGCPWHP